jgi:hypothetical protein
MHNESGPRWYGDGKIKEINLNGAETRVGRNTVLAGYKKLVDCV